MPHFRILRGPLSTLKASLARATRRLRDRLSLPPLTCILLYIQAIVIVIYLWVGHYRTPRDGDKSLIVIYNDYIVSPSSICSLLVKTAWNNDLIGKQNVILCQFAAAFSMWLCCLYLFRGDGEPDVMDGRAIFMTVVWFSLAGGITNAAALWFEIWWMGEPQGQGNMGPGGETMRPEELELELARIRRDLERRAALLEEASLHLRRLTEEMERGER